MFQFLCNETRVRFDQRFPRMVVLVQKVEPIKLWLRVIGTASAPVIGIEESQQRAARYDLIGVKQPVAKLG